LATLLPPYVDEGGFNGVTRLARAGLARTARAASAIFVVLFGALAFRTTLAGGSPAHLSSDSPERRQVPTAEHRMSHRHRLVLSLGLAVSSLVGGSLAAIPVAAQEADIDGDYRVVNTVTQTTQTCTAPNVGDTVSGVIHVRRLSSSKVEFSLGNSFVATIDDDLNFDATLTGSGAVDTFEGHFTVNADGTARIEWTERLEGVCGDIGPGDVVYKLEGDRRAVATVTPSPNASPLPTPSASGDPLVGYEEAVRAWDAACPDPGERDCEGAVDSAIEWSAAQRASIAAALGEAGPEFALPLARLKANLSQVVRFVYLPDRCPATAPAPGMPYPARYPAIGASSKYFSILWGQGLRATLNGDLADLETTLTRADALLALLLEMERRDPVPGCP
jgi:hypothetical protein